MSRSLGQSSSGGDARNSSPCPRAGRRCQHRLPAGDQSPKREIASSAPAGRPLNRPGPTSPAGAGPGSFPREESCPLPGSLCPITPGSRSRVLVSWERVVFFPEPKVFRRQNATVTSLRIGNASWDLCRGAGGEEGRIDVLLVPRRWCERAWGETAYSRGIRTRCDRSSSPTLGRRLLHEGKIVEEGCRPALRPPLPSPFPPIPRSTLN